MVDHTDILCNFIKSWSYLFYVVNITVVFYFNETEFVGWSDKDKRKHDQLEYVKEI